jgi:hypothetical protein
MKTFFTSLGVSFALATAAFAGPLNTRGIPPEVIGFVHADLEATKKNPLGQNVIKLYSDVLLKSEAKKFAEFKAKTGIDPLTDIYDVTFGVLPPEKKKNADGEAANEGRREPSCAITIVRGKFSEAKVRAFVAGLHENGKTLTIEKHVFFKNGDTLLLPLDNVALFVYGDGKELEAVAKTALAALIGKGKSYAPPAALANFGKQTTAPFVLSHFNLVSLNIPKPSPDNPMEPQAPDEIFAALGEAAGILKLRAAARYPSESEAQQFLAKAQMGIGLAQMYLGKSAKPSDGSKPKPTEAKFAAEAGKILSALKITTTGKHFNASLDYSSTTLAQLITDVAKLAQGDDVDTDDGEVEVKGK